jgi:uncharacterized protein YcbX
MATGTVRSLHRWPVKSLGGEEVDALRIDRRGAGGDRAQAILGTFGGAQRPLTVRQAPRMLGWTAAYPHAPGAALDPDAPRSPRSPRPTGASTAGTTPRCPARCATTSPARWTCGATSPSCPTCPTRCS